MLGKSQPILSYKIPDCGVCKQPLLKSFVSLGCGHVVHQYCAKDLVACPHCGAEVKKKEIRRLHVTILPVEIKSEKDYEENARMYEKIGPIGPANRQMALSSNFDGNAIHPDGVQRDLENDQKEFNFGGLTGHRIGNLGMPDLNSSAQGKMDQYNQIDPDEDPALNPDGVGWMYANQNSNKKKEDKPMRMDDSSNGWGFFGIGNKKRGNDDCNAPPDTDLSEHKTAIRTNAPPMKEKSNGLFNWGNPKASEPKGPGTYKKTLERQPVSEVKPQPILKNRPVGQDNFPDSSLNKEDSILKTDSPVTDQILRLVNLLRTNPKEFSTRYLTSRLINYKGKQYLDSHGVWRTSEEGKGACVDAIRHCEEIEPRGQLTEQHILSSVVKEFVDKQARESTNSDIDWECENVEEIFEQVDRHGRIKGKFSTVGSVTFTSALDIVLNWVIDDGNQSRANRKKVLGSTLKVVGLGYNSYHKRYQSSCCMLLAESFLTHAERKKEEDCTLI